MVLVIQGPYIEISIRYLSRLLEKGDSTQAFINENPSENALTFKKIEENDSCSPNNFIPDESTCKFL